jgi:hypothetical protein
MPAHATFAEILVSELVRRSQPSGWDQFWAMCALLAALAAYFAFEYGLSRLLSLVVSSIRDAHRQNRKGPKHKL